MTTVSLNVDDAECAHSFEECIETHMPKVERCLKCGIERVISSFIEGDAEWRYFKERPDPSRSRCVYKPYASNIHAVQNMLRTLNINNEYIPEIEDLYKKIIKGDIIRYPFNVSILFICTFMTYKNKQCFLEYAKLQHAFNITKKQVSTAMKYFHMKIKVNNISFSSKMCVTIEEYIANICKDMRLHELIQPNIESDVLLFYTNMKQLSECLNHSVPKTAAIALIRQYVKSKHEDKKHHVLTMPNRFVVSENSVQKIEKDLISLRNEGW